MHVPSTAALTIADKISDPMMPELDPSLLDFRPIDIDFNSRKDDPLNWNSQILSDPSGIEIGRHAPARDLRTEFDEDDMNVDIDLDIGGGPTLDLGRKHNDLDFELDLPDNERLPDDFEFEDRTRMISPVPDLIPDNDHMGGDQMALDDDDFQLQYPNEDADPVAAADPRLARLSQSPLSSARSSAAREFEASRLDDDEDSTMHQAKQRRAKKRKIIQEDSDTMLPSNRIKQQQTDRSAILKPISFLSRDPLVFNLMHLQQTGGFVSSIMGDGRSKGWAKELQGILSFDTACKAGEKRKRRDSGVADVSENEPQADNEAGPQLEIPDETFGAPDAYDIGPDDIDGDQSRVHLPADSDAIPLGDDDVDEDDAIGDTFDVTRAPLLHPSEQGAVSQGTKHAVHLLRDRFSTGADGSPSKLRKNHIMFQNLLPETTTSKADATKMFFEVLVLATKDAVKVEQGNQEVGSALRIRAKQGLWGDWAEEEAGGEIAEEHATAGAVAE